MAGVSFNVISSTCVYTSNFIGTVQLEMQTKSPYEIFRNLRRRGMDNSTFALP